LALNVFFDVDYTILAVDGSLRPRTRETFELLVNDGHSIYIWSGVGLRKWEVKKHDLESFVTGIYQKPIQDFVAGLEEMKVPLWPDFVIDDYPEIVDVFGGILVQPYFFKSDSDDQMDRIYSIITEFVETGESGRVGYRAATAARPPGA
jgi:hypothetical protein|tara:strand:- start:7462 stop:7908 length:447 start_codon:yes stop_codon:yes gene_type:complete